MNIKKVFLLLGAVLVLSFLYYAISPIFKNVYLDENLPVEKKQNIGELKDNTKIIEVKNFNTDPSPIIGTKGHPASGSTRIINIDGKNYLRYENYKTINGPDIYVYLAKDIEAKEFISLGKVKATEGNINYEIPNGINPKDYPYALTWCKAFGVLFNYTKLYE